MEFHLGQKLPEFAKKQKTRAVSMVGATAAVIALTAGDCGNNGRECSESNSFACEDKTIYTGMWFDANIDGENGKDLGICPTKADKGKLNRQERSWFDEEHWESADTNVAKVEQVSRSFPNSCVYNFKSKKNLPGVNGECKVNTRDFTQGDVIAQVEHYNKKNNVFKYCSWEVITTVPRQ